MFCKSNVLSWGNRTKDLDSSRLKIPHTGRSVVVFFIYWDNIKHGANLVASNKFLFDVSRSQLKLFHSQARSCTRRRWRRSGCRWPSCSTTRPSTRTKVSHCLVTVVIFPTTRVAAFYWKGTFLGSCDTWYKISVVKYCWLELSTALHHLYNL